MKILYVCKSLPKSFQGGIQTHIWHLSAHIADLGHNVSILTAGGFRKKTIRYTSERRTIIELPYLPLRYQPFMRTWGEEWSFNMSVNLWLQRHAHEYDIIHLQGRSGFIFPKKMNLVPIVTTLHGLVNLENARSFNEKTLDKKVHERWANRYEKNSLAHSDALIAVSGEMQEEIESIMPQVKHKIHIIPNGVERPLTIEENITDNNLLLFVGRLESIKGIFNLLKAMKAVDSHVKLVLVGEGTERPAIEKLIHTEGLAKRVKLTGALQSDDVMKWVNRCYALILPSFHETQGIVLLEANAYSKPVLASNIGGIKEVVENNQNGLLFNPHDSHDITTKINQLFRNPQLAQQLGEEGKRIVESKFLWDSIAHKTELLYKNLIIRTQSMRHAVTKHHQSYSNKPLTTPSYSHAQK